MIEKVDMVIPYVNNKDRVWLDTYVNYCKKHRLYNKIVAMRGNRYDCGDLINYQLKLIKKNMPFINKIYLLLSNKEQAPKELPNNCVIVLHKDFIPRQHLPTFNSTTIEMFLWNIKNLGEHFIYANDDMLPTQKLQLCNFFAENGKIKIKMVYNPYSKVGSQFQNQCMNSYQHIYEAKGLSCSKLEYVKPVHSFTPMIKSHCKEAYDLIKNKINENIWAFRTDYQHNQYIYPIYEMLTFGIEDSDVDFKYVEINNKEDLDLNHQITCINEIPNYQLYGFVINELEKLL